MDNQTGWGAGAGFALIIALLLIQFAPLIVSLCVRPAWLVFLSALLSVASLIIGISAFSGGVFGAAIGINAAGLTWLGAMVCGAAAFLSRSQTASLQKHASFLAKHLEGERKDID